MLSMTTRDRNRIALESDALGASALGIGAILCLSGNHQSLGVCPQAAGANDIDSIQLTQALKGLDLPELAGRGGGPPSPAASGTEPAPAQEEDRGRGGLPADAAGVRPGRVHSWMDAVRAAGLDKQAAIIASVLPLTSVEQAESLRQRQTYGPLDEAVVARLAAASDPAKEGLAMAVEMAGQLKTVPGVRGIHILSGGSEALAGEVIQAAGLA